MNNQLNEKERDVHLRASRKFSCLETSLESSLPMSLYSIELTYTSLQKALVGIRVGFEKYFLCVWGGVERCFS